VYVDNIVIINNDVANIYAIIFKSKSLKI